MRSDPRRAAAHENWQAARRSHPSWKRCIPLRGVSNQTDSWCRRSCGWPDTVTIQTNRDDLRIHSKARCDFLGGPQLVNFPPNVVHGWRGLLAVCGVQFLDVFGEARQFLFGEFMATGGTEEGGKRPLENRVVGHIR